MKKKCSGYRNQLDLMFRDESTKTHAKVARWAQRNNHRLNPKTMAAPERCIPAAVSNLWSTADHSVIFRFYHYIRGNLSEKDPVRGLHEYLPGLYIESNPGSALRLAAQAISYATSTKLGQKNELLARRFYTGAIRAMSQAIQDPVEAMDEKTLYAVLLLSGYEVSFLALRG